VRNWYAAGEPILFTSASGINLEIGNNAESRRLRTMVSPYTNFEPRKMHQDARIYVMTLIGGNPTPSEVSSRFTRMAIDEFVREPVASVVFCAQKTRWFWSPAEVPSSASLANDLRFTPLLRLAFVPTWLVAAAALVGAIVHRRRRDVLCGPGALVLAHVVVLTLVFPISHYRSPAIPALAVLAGGAVQAALGAWSAGSRRTAMSIGASVAACAVVGALPPQPERGRHADAVLLALDSRDRGRMDEAVEYARESMRVFAEDLPGEPELATTWKLLGEIEARRGRLDDALAAFDRAIAIQPLDWRVWLMSSKAAQDAGNLVRAEAHARRAAHDYPLLGLAFARLGEVLLNQGRRPEAAEAIRRALELGAPVDPAIERALRIR
jgi:Tfp pilus assembly protein PilF